MKILRRIPSAFLLFVGIAAALSAVSIKWPWCAIPASILTVITVAAQHETQGTVVVPFTSVDWTMTSGEFRFSAGRNHGKGKKPNVSVFVPSPNGGYEEVVCAVNTLASGEVVVGANLPLDGEVRIS